MAPPTTTAPDPSLFLPDADADPLLAQAAPVPGGVGDESGETGESSVAPAAPTTLAETGLSSEGILTLILKALYTGELSGRELSDEIRISYAILEPFIEASRVQQLIEVRSATGAGTAGYLYAVTDRGRERGRQYFDANGYVGAAPVPLDQYVRYVNELGKHKSVIDREVIASGMSE